MNKVIVAGAGGIGRAVALLLLNQKQFKCRVFIGDIRVEAAQEAVDWVKSALSKRAAIEGFEMKAGPLKGDSLKIFKAADILLDCLPGSQAPRMAKFCIQHKMHYANLTEYVAETEEIKKLAKKSSKGFILQTGLAPGFINILAVKLFNAFCEQHGVKKVDSIEMKVGALTKHAKQPHFYGFTWSTVGVATEYLKPCIAVRNGKKVNLKALSQPKTIIVDGLTLEEDLTSGGAANLPDFYKGRVKNLDYKTLRFPGHYKWVKKVVSKIPRNVDKIKSLRKTMEKEIPMCEDDQVIIYCSVTGKDKDKIHRTVEKSYKINPIQIGKVRLKAIQSTTAAPLAECCRMLLNGKIKGVHEQSDIDPDSFINGIFNSLVYSE